MYVKNICVWKPFYSAATAWYETKFHWLHSMDTLGLAEYTELCTFLLKSMCRALANAKLWLFRYFRGIETPVGQVRKSCNFFAIKNFISVYHAANLNALPFGLYILICFLKTLDMHIVYSSSIVDPLLQFHCNSSKTWFGSLSCDKWSFGFGLGGSGDYFLKIGKYCFNWCWEWTETKVTHLVVFLQKYFPSCMASIFVKYR